MLLLQKIVGFIILLGGLVAVHELGHFWVAKLLGVRVLKFSIGFGPKLWGFRRGETEYVLAWIPLGGFVRMAGELPKDYRKASAEGEASLHEGEASRHEREASRHEGEASLHEGETSSHEGEASRHEREVSPHEREASPHEGETSSHEREASRHEGETSSHEGEASDAEEEAQNLEEEARSFLAQPWWKRGAIALAGPVFSILFPVLVFFVVYWGNVEVPLPRIGSVVAGLPAAQAGLLPGDVLTKIDGIPIQAFSDISEVVRKRWEKDIVVEYQRDGALHSTSLRPKKHEEVTLLGKKPQGLLGVSTHARPAVVGVLGGSAAQEAGLQTFDRVLEVNGEPIRDEVALLKALKAAASPLQLRVARARHEVLAGLKLQVPEVLLLRMPKQEGEGYEAMGALPGDLFVAEVLPGSAAEKAGLQRGDRLLEWEREPIHSWEAMAQRLRGLEGKPFHLSWLSPEGRREATLAQEQKEALGELKHRLQVWELGLRPQLAYRSTEDALRSAAKPETRIVHVGFWQAWGKALKVVPEVTLQTAEGIAKLLTGKVSAENVGGPVLIFQATAMSAQEGLGSYLSLMALLSINFALLNLLPLPILDGFTVLASLWEGLRRKPLPMRFREIASLVGLVLLVLLMAYALKNDIARLLR